MLPYEKKKDRAAIFKKQQCFYRNNKMFAVSRVRMLSFGIYTGPQIPQ